ncbi:tRNA (cytosine(34)-C(5))-methyltransferase [Culicoides brevitarsis]|uniref:tRNA (cytosine(34)-C(5))-methyltransferase n=1 Tax=Culicoides brevitarsis TaxID=469753 RepID=UPI00307BE166
MARKRNKNQLAKKNKQKRNDRLVSAGFDPRGNQPYQEIVRENENFMNYYQHQKICKTPEEWDEFLKALRTDLPSTFRVTGSKKEANLLNDVIKKEFLAEYVSVVAELHQKDKSEVPPPRSFPWYPGGLAWELNFTRQDIRRSEPLLRLHNFLVTETNSGNISRQEAVSMIPPLVLDVHSHHKILDMCAAPGSKTAQIIEALHNDQDKGPPTGFVVANDVDNKRCYMLVHQAKRLNSPCCMIVNADASVFPRMKIQNSEGKLEYLKFDRILADVPCSGDGTMRKNPDIWTRWSIGQGNSLHGLQYRILKRGLELLDIGGRIVYSTCSLNPVENEAVISHMLQECDDAVELLDVSKEVEGLNYNPGMQYWEVCDNTEKKFYNKPEDMPERLASIIRPCMFPPQDPEVLKKLNLERCIRVLPQHNNTGAFFVAVLTKKKALPWRRNEDQDPPEWTAAEKAAEDGAPPPPKKRKQHQMGFKEDPFYFFTKDEPMFLEIKKEYDISEDFQPENLLRRSLVGKTKYIYYVTEATRNVISSNEKSIKIINAGIKAFTRCYNKQSDRCSFRLAQEGLPSLTSFIGPKRRIIVEKDDLIHLLKNIDPTNPPEITDVGKKMRDQLNLIEPGSCIVTYETDEICLNVAAWKGVRTVRAYTEVNDAVHCLRLLGADVSQYEQNKFKKVETADEVAEETNETTSDAQLMEEVAEES